MNGLEELIHISSHYQEEHILNFFGTVYKKAPVLRIILLDIKLPQQAGHIVAIYYVVSLSEIWQEFNMAFSIEGYESFVFFYG